MRKPVLFKGQLVLYDGFNQYPELSPGDVYCVDAIRDDMIQIYGETAWYDSYLFSSYQEGTTFEHFDSSGQKNTDTWYIPEIGEDYALRLRRINWMREYKELVSISIADIQWYQEEQYNYYNAEKEMKCPCCKGYRTIRADISKPIVLLDGTTTITGKRYRSLDGSHRIQKLLYYGHKDALCYVFHIDEVRNYYQPKSTFGERTWQNLRSH